MAENKTYSMASEAAPIIQGINSYKGTNIDNDSDYHKICAQFKKIAKDKSKKDKKTGKEEVVSARWFRHA